MSPGNLTRSEARERAALIADVAYDITVDITGEKTFTSDTKVSFRCLEPGSSTFIDLLAREATPATLNGREFGDYDGHRLALPDLDAENELHVRAIHDYEHTGVGLHRMVDPADGAHYLYTQFEPRDARRQFACFDQPDLKARISLSVLAPADWTVVSNSPVADRPADGEAGTWRFAPTPRLSTYLAVIVAGPYHAAHDRHRDIPLTLYCRQSMQPYLDADDIFLITKQGLDYFEEQFDQPYPFTKYDQAFVPEYFGAMEHPGCVTFGDGFLARGTVTEDHREARARTILHEMAHMWFGDLVTMQWWDDLWLNESFATYMATRASVQATRFVRGWARFATDTKAYAIDVDQRPSTHPISADIVDKDSLTLHFDAITYNKGASVLRQLSAWVGEDAFDEAVRTYLGNNAWDNASLDDFLVALETASDRDMTTWAKEWLEASGVNTLRVVDGAIEQTAPDDHPTLRSHRVGIGSYRLKGGRLRRYDYEELDVSGRRTELVPRKADLLLVNDGDLAYAKVDLDTASVATVMAHLSSIDDPLARTVCWSALYHMVRDGQLPARRFVDVVVRHGFAEPELTTASRLVGWARGLANFYGDPGHRDAVRTALESAVKSRLASSAPGTDEQRDWAEWVIALAGESAGFASIRSWLRGSCEPTGLDVDVTLRWAIVRTLCRGGSAGEELIAEELARDPTDKGKRSAAAANAGRPDPDVKAAVWRQMVDDVEFDHATLFAVAQSFFQYGQEHFVLPFVPQLGDAIAAVFGSREHETALRVARVLVSNLAFPDEAVAATFQQLLDQSDLDDGVRRVVRDELDSVTRALRTRAVDAAAATAG